MRYTFAVNEYFLKAEHTLKKRAYEIANEYAGKLSALKGTSAVLLGDTFDTEVYDPDFTIDLDVYYHGQLAPASERMKVLGNPELFESPPEYPVDRFLVSNLPVLVNYKRTDRISDIFRRIAKHEWVFRKATTNVLYRLKNGEILYNKNNWILTVRKRFTKIPANFWGNILTSAMFLVEYHYRELTVSNAKCNHLHYQISLGNFIHSICGFAFALNEQFEPGPREIYGKLCGLKELPDEFVIRFDILINPANEYSMEKKCEVARLLTSSLIKMKEKSIKAS